jgi:hypothetical protein
MGVALISKGTTAQFPAINSLVLPEIVGASYELLLLKETRYASNRIQNQRQWLSYGHDLYKVKPL